MSETTTNNINEKDKKPERTSHMGNQNNEGYPAFTIVFMLFACIWMLAGFTVFKYIAIIVLMVHFVKSLNSNSTSNNNETNTSSSSQVFMKCSSRTRNDTIFDSSATTYDSTAINVKESEAELEKDGEHSEIVSTEMEQQRTNDEFVGQDDNSGVLTNDIAQLSKSIEKEINNSIVKEDTVALLITSNDDSNTSTTSPVQTTADAAMSATSSNILTTPTPIIQKSAFVTENVMELAVSYSGKERKRVLNITRILKKRMTTDECPHPIFIDQDFQHEICRLNGLSHLLSIYRQAHLVIVFLSPTYTNSRYCSGEWRTIAQRFLSNRKNKEATQVLLVKLGKYDMEQLDLVENDFAVNGMRMSNEQIADIIFRRWEIVKKNLEHNKQ